MTSTETFVGAVCATSEHSDNERSIRDLVLDRSATRVLAVIAAAFAVLRIWAMFAVPLTDTTEARYAEIARKMVETGNWLTPQFDYGVPFWGKPPLHTWLSAAGMQAFGVNEAAARIPILLVTIVILALIWVWVRDVAGRNLATVSTVMLGTTGLFFGASAFVMTDMPMVLGTTLVMVGFWNTVCRPDASPAWGHAVFAGLAIGLLAKGPVAVVLCGIPLSLWLVFTGRWARLKRLPWLGGGAILLLLTVPWYAAAETATPGFLNYFLIGEHFQRFVTPGWQGDLYGSAHVQPKGMIWLLWLGAALPWSVVPLILLARFRDTTAAFAQDNSGWLLYLLLWALSPMLLFTAASNILAAYVLPGLPAAAILFTVLGARIVGGRSSMRVTAGFATAAATIFLLFGVYSVAAVLLPNKVPLRSYKEIVAAAQSAVPEATFHVVGGRSFSADFYTRGHARTVDPDEIADLTAQPGPVAVAVPASLADAATGAGLENVGAYGRNLLFVKRSNAETE